MIIDLGTKAAIKLAIECFCIEATHTFEEPIDRYMLGVNLSDIVTDKEKQKYWIVRHYPDIKVIEEETKNTECLGALFS